MEPERTRIAKAILRKKNKTGGIALSDFMQSTKLQQSKQNGMALKADMNQWNRRESPKINPQIYGQFIFNKVMRIYNGEKIVSSASGIGKAGQLQHIKINS